MAKRHSEHDSMEPAKKRRNEGPIPAMYHIFNGEVCQLIYELVSIVSLFA